MHDPNSEVTELKNSDRNYAVLGYLAARPRTTYLSKIRNPNPKMPNAYDQPYTRKEYEARNGHGGGHHGEDHKHNEESVDKQ